MDDSTTQPATRKQPRFSLWFHTGTGQWSKKIKGKHYYFGSDKDKSLETYVREKPYIEKHGRRPPEDDPDGTERVTLKKAFDTFLTHKKHQVALGEIRQVTYNDYKSSCQALSSFLGKNTVVSEILPEDLLRYRQKLGKKLGPTTIGNEVNRCRVALRFAFENGLIDRPVRFGEFKRPNKASIRRQRAKQGPRLFEPDVIKQLIGAADVQLVAMIMLGLNCGFGNADCGSLPISAIDLKTGWIDFPRPKTGVARRCPLWPETIQAIRKAIDKRNTPKEKQHASLLFITKYGQPWSIDGGTGSPLSAEFKKLLTAQKAYRKGLSFYTLRHVFQTIGDETGDYLAVRRVMGHSDNSISDNYRERFQDERLKRVVDHVRTWLFPPEPIKGKPAKKVSKTTKTN